MEIIPESKESFLSCYADDYAMIHCFSPDNNNMKQNTENDICKIKTWIDENQLKINDAKTEFILLGTAGNLKKNTLVNIKIGHTIIHRTSRIKFLAVHLHEKLTLKDYVQNRSRKSNYNLGLI